MKILHVATELPKASGITTFVENVSAELRAAGHEVVVRDISSTPYHLIPNPSDFDVVHLHGLWRPTFHKIASAVYHLSRNADHSDAKRPRLVWSPHGMLQKWALKNKWWKKIPALALYQWWDLRRADVIHVTAASEVEDVRRLGLGNEVVVAPLGVRLKKVGGSSGSGTKDGKALLFVSRVQRKKGLPNLLEAWAGMPEEMKKDWTIRIVGPDEDGHTAGLMRLCERLGIRYKGVGRRVEFIGAKYGSELDAEYENADLFVLPTHSENFGSVVIEALAHEVPVICTKAAPWEELVTHRCGRWVEDSVEALEAALKEMMAMSDAERLEMGARGRRLVEEKYTWEAVARKMLEGYGESRE